LRRLNAPGGAAAIRIFQAGNVVATGNGVTSVQITNNNGNVRVTAGGRGRTGGVTHPNQTKNTPCVTPPPPPGGLAGPTPPPPPPHPGRPQGEAPRGVQPLRTVLQRPAARCRHGRPPASAPRTAPVGWATPSKIDGALVGAAHPAATAHRGAGAGKSEIPDPK